MIIKVTPDGLRPQGPNGVTAGIAPSQRTNQTPLTNEFGEQGTTDEP